jgi:hypothetical protein
MNHEASNPRRTQTVRAFTAFGVLCALGGCSTPAHRVDAASPVAAQAAAAAANPGPYPKFSDIPAAPDDVRAGAAWKGDVVAVQSAGARINAQAAPDASTPNDTEAFAERLRRLAAEGGEAPTEEASRAAADGFARIARERATPPPSTR